MSDSKVSDNPGTDWSDLRKSAESLHSVSEWTAGQYDALVNLIQHADLQLVHTNRYHLLAIAFLIPIHAVLMKIQVPLYTHMGLLVLGVAVGVRWLTLASKLNLEKLCWITLAREVERHYFADGTGPYTAQGKFFSELPKQLSVRDKFLMRRIGPKRMYLISIILIAFALIAGGLAALGGGFSVTF